MSKWLLRGLVFAVLMVIVRLLQGALINLWESGALIISVTLVVLFAIAAFIWGLADGRGDARANPDPDRRGDLAMTWLLAGLFAGIVSGFVAWFTWLFVHLFYLIGPQNRLLVLVRWTFSYLTGSGGARLITGPETGPPRGDPRQESAPREAFR